VLIAYVGFIQSGNTRSFNFEGRPVGRSGDTSKHIELSMTADLSLVTRFQIKFQDLPGICLRAISAAVEALGDGEKGPGTYTLTEAAVRAHCTSLANPVRTEHRRRFHPKPTENSQLQWPKRV
jgi:hypothetical protein